MPVELAEDVEGDEPKAQDTELPDVEYLSSGKVKLRVDRKTYVLRRPLLGELQDLRELFYEAQDEQRRLLIARLEADMATNKAEAEATAANNVEARIAVIQESLDRAQQMRKQAAEAETTYLRWSRQAVETLAGKKLPEDDRKLPVYLTTLAFVQGVQQHWMAVPLPSGVQ